MTIQLGKRLFRLRRGAAWTLIILAALAAFEVFNYSTTEYALDTFFGGHYALGLTSWATILAIAFCGLDFAGLSRLFTPETEWHKEPREVWLLTAAWLMGATMNAAMTWWAVASALMENRLLGNELITREQLLHIVPLFVAVLVWMTRVSLIGSIISSGDHLFRSTAIIGSARRTSSARQSGATQHQRELTGRTPARQPRTEVLPSWRSEPRPRGGMPIGARASQPIPANELDYVDLDTVA